MPQGHGSRMTRDDQSESERPAPVKESAGDRQAAGVIAELLQELASGGGVQGGGVWRGNGNGETVCVVSVGPAYRSWATGDEHGSRLNGLRRESLQSAERRLIPLGPGADVGLERLWPSAVTLVHWPVAADSGRRLLELLFDPSADESQQRFVLRRLQNAEAEWNSAMPARAVNGSSMAVDRDWDDFLLRLHRSLRIDDTCYAIANDGRRLIGCDRVSVLVRAGDRLRLASVSGVDLPDRRSNVVRTIEAAAAAAIRTGRRVEYSERAGEHPPQLQEPFSEYADANHVRAAVFVPLAVDEQEGSAEPVGALIAEWFVDADTRECHSPIDRIAGHAATALQNGLQHADVAWARLLLPVLWARDVWQGGRRKWTIAAAVALAVLTAVLVFVPAPLIVTARGELRPVARQPVYAPMDAIVQQVKVDDEALVQAGDPLLVLSNPELELELQRVIGAIDTWEQKLAAIGFQRLDGDRRDDPAAAGRMSGEEAEARQELESLLRQQALLETKRDWLTVTAPIAGRVTTWNVREELESRPVRTGERLLNIADVGSGWELELLLDERAAGHAVTELAKSPDGLDVEFLSASGPEATRTATLRELADAVYWQRGGEVRAPARAEILDADTSEFRAGTTVSARIDCGRRSLGYVWFHSVYEAIVRRLWY